MEPSCSCIPSEKRASGHLIGKLLQAIDKVSILEANPLEPLFHGRVFKYLRGHQMYRFALVTMDLSKYLRQDEILQLNQKLEASLHHDPALVFWTGISPSLAKDWANKNNLKTLTMAMGSLYSDKSQKSQRSGKGLNSWSSYMKGASWIFARHACHNRYAIVLTNEPPNVYSTRGHSTYREIEEPILKGLEVDQHTMHIDYVHPAVPGAECFRYQIWPDNRSHHWLTFLENISVKALANKILQCADFRPSNEIRGQITKLESSIALHHKSVDASSIAIPASKGGYQRQETTWEKRQQQIPQEERVARQRKVDRQQQIVQEKKAAKQRKVERQQQMAREKVARQRKVEKQQQMAQEKKAAKRLEMEREQQVAQKKLAKQIEAKAKL